MKRRNAIGALAIALVASTFLSACGSGASGGTVTIKMLIASGPDEGGAMAPVIEAYNEGQGKKDDVRVEQVELSSTDVYTKEATEMASRSSNFDVYLTGSYYATAHANSLEPIEGIDLSALSKKGIKATTVGGKTVAVPFLLSQHVLIYRKDWMKQLLTSADYASLYGDISEKVVGKELEPKEPSEWNWDDYLATAAFFSNKYNPDSPSQYGTALPLKSSPYNVMFWDNVLWGEGGSWLNGQGKPALDSDAALRAMELYQAMYTDGIATPNSAQGQFDELQKSMQSGSIALMQQWIAGAPPLNDAEQSPKTAGNIGIAPVPGKKAHVHFEALGINKYGKNKEAAQKWLSYLVTPEAQKIFMDAGGFPTNLDVLASSDEDAIKKLAEYVDKYGFVEPSVGDGAKYQVYEQLGQALSAGWVTQESAQDSLNKAQAVLRDAATR